MRRLVRAFAALALILPVRAWGDEGASVGTGVDGLPTLVRLPAPTEPAAGFGLGVGFGYGYTGDVLGAGDVHHRTAASLGVGWRATRWLGLALRMDGRHDAHSSDGGDDDGWVFDSRLAARAGFPVGERVRLGVDLALWFPGADPFVPAPEGVSADLAGSIALRPARRVLVVGRVGFRLDRSAGTVSEPERLSAADRLGLGVSESDAVLLGAGVHVGLGGGAELSGELTWDLLVGDAAPAALESPLRLGLGARYPLATGWTVEGAVEIALSERPMLVPDVLVPVEPRVSVLVRASWRFGGGARAGVRGDGEIGVGDGGVVGDGGKKPDEVAKDRIVRGRLVDPGGAPIAGAVVRAGGRETTTDAEGRFELAVPAGTTEVSIEPPLPWAPRTTALGDGPGAELALGDLPVERETPPGQVRGVVRNLKGTPVAATVRLEPSGETVQAAADGSFQLDVAPGEYDVVIEAPGFRPQKRHVIVEQEGVTVLNVELAPERGKP